MRNLWRMRLASVSSSRVARPSSGQALEQVGALRGKGVAAGCIACVEHRAVGQHDAHPGHRVVTVLRRAAAHATGVVGGDAADHRGVDARPGRARSCGRNGASRRLATAPMTPGCSEIVCASSPTSMPRQPSPSITSTESVMAWPDRLVPAARKVTGVCSFAQHCENARAPRPRSRPPPPTAAPGGRSWRHVPQASRRSGSLIKRAAGMKPARRCCNSLYGDVVTATIYDINAPPSA